MTECTLIPGKFGILVQGVLFLVSISVLVLKKTREANDRTWYVFLLDSSKQLAGAAFVHVLNLLTSTVLGHEEAGDACDWYWTNIMIDTTLGVFLEYLWLKALGGFLEHPVVARFSGDPRDWRFGEYTDESGVVDKRIYFKQLGLWLCCIIGMKVIVVILMLMLSHILFIVASSLLILVSWNPQVKLVFVMVLTPACMNAVQFWLTDNFIQKGGVSLKQLKRGCRRWMSSCSRLRGKEHSGHDFYSDEEEESPRREPSRRRSHDRGHEREVSNDRFSEPFLVAEHYADEERAQHLAQIERLTSEFKRLELVEARQRREKDLAEEQAKINQDQMLDAQEKLYKLEQELRMKREETHLLQERLSVKEEHEKQLKLRVQQLEFSYSQAGSAAQAVFAAEVSAATVAAASAFNSTRSYEVGSTPAQSPPREPLEPRALENGEASNIEQQFLTTFQVSSSPPATPGTAIPGRLEAQSSPPGTFSDARRTPPASMASEVRQTPPASHAGDVQPTPPGSHAGGENGWVTTTTATGFRTVLKS